MEIHEEYLVEQTEDLWGTLQRTFPQADIRFQHEEGSSTLHILFRDTESPEDHSVCIDLEQTQNAIFEAIFSIKEVLKQFDA